MPRRPTGVSVEFWKVPAFCTVGVCKLQGFLSYVVTVCNIQGLRVKEFLPISELVVSEVNHLNLGMRELLRQSYKPFWPQVCLLVFIGGISKKTCIITLVSDFC